MLYCTELIIFSIFLQPGSGTGAPNPPQFFCGGSTFLGLDTLCDGNPDCNRQTVCGGDPNCDANIATSPDEVNLLCESKLPSISCMDAVHYFMLPCRQVFASTLRSMPIHKVV